MNWFKVIFSQKTKEHEFNYLDVGHYYDEPDKAKNTMLWQYSNGVIHIKPGFNEVVMDHGNSFPMGYEYSGRYDMNTGVVSIGSMDIQGDPPKALINALFRAFKDMKELWVFHWKKAIRIY